MSYPTMPLADRQDSQYFDIEADDPAKKENVEGGYSISRPKFTRRPPRTYTTGFSDLSESEKDTLYAFWDQVLGGSNAFWWVRPNDQQSVLVRFAEKFRAQYKGRGGNHRYDIANIKVKEV